MFTKCIILNVILALSIKFSTQLSHNKSDTYQNDWGIETNLLDFDDDSNEELMAFNPCLVKYCPKGMECTISKNIPICVCQRECILYNKRKRRNICGSDGKLYENFCELYRVACITGSPIQVSDMSQCVHHEPSCSSEEFAIMKDNILFYHHQNTQALKHGPNDEIVHRLDYLVSIIFSYYDQNNDGLVERDELDLMWDTMNHHVANDSNCTLRDLLVFDDTNGDGVMTINEFNDAFHRISEINEQKMEKTLTDRAIPKIHLDMSLAVNLVNSRIGDNIEIKCDITGVLTTNGFIWKRFGFDLSQMHNDSNDYEEDVSDDSAQEIKLTSDGGLFIQNVQMKHAGNYTCQVSSNGQVVQTHILAVHTTPSVLVSPKMQSKRPGEFAEIFCHSMSEYVSVLTWLKNEKPLEQNDEKYMIIGNGTMLRINDLTFFDSASYRCCSATGHSVVSTLVVENQPNAIAINSDQKVFVFHSNGISIHSSSLCQLLHEIRASDFVPGSKDTICHQYARRCTWGQAVVVDGSDGLIYISQPMMNRLLVLSIAQLIIIEVIQTDSTPMELYHVPVHDQLWIVNYNLHRDGTIKSDPAKTLQMIPDVRMIHVKHHPIHPEHNNGKIMNFHVPPVFAHRNHIYDYKYGLVTHHKQRGFFKLDLTTMRYSKYIDLSIYDCVPEHIKFGGLYGFLIISCMEPVTLKQTGQLVVDSITNSIISIKADLVGTPHVSPDSRFVITLTNRHDSVLLSVQQISLNGLIFAFDVETTLNISEIRFIKSTSSLEYDVYASTDKAEILCLSLDTGKVETITDVGEPAISSWFNGGRKIIEADLFTNLIGSPSKDSVFIINTRTKNITCEIGKLENPSEIVWA